MAGAGAQLDMQRLCIEEDAFPWHDIDFTSSVTDPPHPDATPDQQIVGVPLVSPGSSNEGSAEKSKATPPTIQDTQHRRKGSLETSSSSTMQSVNENRSQRYVESEATKPDALKAPTVPKNAIRKHPHDQRLAHRTGTCTSKPSHRSVELESAKKSSKVGVRITRGDPAVETYPTSQPQRFQTVLDSSTSPSRTVTVLGPTTLGPTREDHTAPGLKRKVEEDPSTSNESSIKSGLKKLHLEASDIEDLNARLPRPVEVLVLDTSKCLVQSIFHTIPDASA
ncbi:hypothetical protein V8D89_006092 [Ganoderma adspersum]